MLQTNPRISRAFGWIVVSMMLGICSVAISQSSAAQTGSRRSVAEPPGEAGVTSAADPVIAAAGSIACDPDRLPLDGASSQTCHMGATADLLTGSDVVIPLGDNQYWNGSLSRYRSTYDRTWGRYKAITRPTVGDHEYQTSGASGYYNYFGAAAGSPSRGYYSYDVGTWHVIALNSNCPRVGGCGAGSPQEEWLRSDLRAHANTCTLAYWHRPRFSSGEQGISPAMGAFWQALYQFRADVVLSGHDHVYERFAPQTPVGAADPIRGVRQFVVGTGGKSLGVFGQILPNSEARTADSYGVLKLTLHESGYDWAFVPDNDGTFTDDGSASCVSEPDASPTPTQSPTSIPSPTSVPSPSATPTSPPGGSAAYRAFGPASYWNTPLPADAPADARSDEFISFLKADNDQNFIRLSGTDPTGKWGNPIYWGGPNHPAHNILNTCSTRQPDEFDDVRIPAGAKPDPTADSAMTVYDIERGMVYGMHWAKQVEGTWSACGGTVYYLESNGLNGRLPQSNDKRNTGHRGVPPSAFAVRYEEISDGDLSHVLKISIGAASPDYVFPMVGSDGESTNQSAPPEGSRIRIKPAVDLRQLDLSPAALVIARALQRYGAIIGDESGGTVNLKVENTIAEGKGFLWNGLLEPGSLSTIPLDSFEVVKLGYGA
jgi:acid phosphatase type 7